MMRRTSFVAFAIAATACSSGSVSERGTASPPVRVETAIVAMRPVPRTFEAGGAVRAWRTATLASRITAPIVAVHVAAGDRVRSGQPLVTLDGRELAANTARAGAETAARERAHTAALAERGAAEAALTLARTSHARIAALHAQDAATAQELDEAVSALRIAEARVSAADAQASAGAASLDAARQAEAAAQATSSYAVVAAPFDGLITERLVDPGALATPATPLLRIDNTSRFRLEVTLDASRLGTVAVGTAVEIALDGDTSESAAARTLRGRVSEIVRILDAGSHTFVAKIDLPTHQTLRSGMFGRARFAGSTENLLTVPPDAIVPQGQLSTVFVVSSDQHAQMRVIDTGIRTPDWVEVLAGLSAGDRVVVAPAGLRDGAAVRAIQTETRR